MGVIYLIRHAQASFGAADYDQLSELGLTQSRVLGEALQLRGPRTDRVVCGTLRRHTQTAEGCLQAMGLAAQWDSDADWNEYHHDDVLHVYDPRFRDPAAMASELAAAENPRRRFQEIFVKSMDRWVGGEHDAEYRESWPAFRTRVERALTRVSASVGKSQGALVFTSGGPIAVACGLLLNLRPQDALRLNTRLANAAVTKLVCSGGALESIQISTVNEHGHFERSDDGAAALITYR
jgi:broad specificity phosphatase PhoE